MKATCSTSPDHKRFSTSVIEYHYWEVDEHGNFEKDIGCEESEKPRSDNLWTCLECGETATVTN